MAAWGALALEPDSVNRHVETLGSLRARADQSLSTHQRRVEGLTERIGQPRSFTLIVAVVAAWCGVNALGPHLGLPAFDPPPFVWLQGLVGLGALLMATLILTTQNRQTKHAEQRARLDLEVNLLAEQKTAKLVSLLEELRRDLPTVPNRVDPVAEAMEEPIDPHAVLAAMED